MAKINFKRAAEQIGVSVPKVRILVREQAIPYYRIGRRIVFDTEELATWLAEHRVEPMRAAARCA